MQIYLSVPLTGAPPDSQETYEAFADLIRKYGHEVHVPRVSPDEGGPVDIYLRDINLIHDSDALVALLLGPSLGVGAEIGLALSASIPVIGLAVHPVSAFVEGLLEQHDLGLLVRDAEVALQKINELGESLEAEPA